MAQLRTAPELATPRRRRCPSGSKHGSTMVGRSGSQLHTNATRAWSGTTSLPPLGTFPCRPLHPTIWPVASATRDNVPRLRASRCIGYSGRP